MKKTNGLTKARIRAICKITGVSLLLFATRIDLVFSEPSAKVSNPSKFKVSYSLNKPSAPGGAFGAPGFAVPSSGNGSASISVNILDERFYPVRAFILRDVKNTSRVESLWDGRDAYGKESPTGNYYASLSIVYNDGSKDSKIFKFRKE